MTCTDYRTSISQSQKFPGEEMAKGYGKAPESALRLQEGFQAAVSLQQICIGSCSPHNEDGDAVRTRPRAPGADRRGVRPLLGSPRKLSCE